VRGYVSRRLEKEADKLLKAYEAADKWKSNRQNKSTPNVTQTKNKGITKKDNGRSL